MGQLDSPHRPQTLHYETDSVFEAPVLCRLRQQ